MTEKQKTPVGSESSHRPLFSPAVYLSLAVLNLGLMPAIMFAQVAATNPAPASGRDSASAKPTAATSTGSQETIVLSPFEVSVASDQGYAARETLAGTRFKTELKDVPAQISVMTLEFLQDIATVDVEDAFRYSINVENRAEYQENNAGDFQTGVVNIAEGNRVRGLSAPGRTHDFFQTYLPGNTYNTERITFSSGPNSILFGNGNPAGTIDTSFKRANVQRYRASLTLRGDDQGSLQASFDLNHPIIKDRVALRIAALKTADENWRAPAGENAERIYGSITIKPTRTTTVRGWYENATIDRISARNTLVGDSVTPWINAGRPIFDNGLASPMPSPAANDALFTRDTTTQNVLHIGALATGTPETLAWGSSGTAVNATARVYSVRTNGPGDAPYQTGTDSYNYSLTDFSISPRDVSVNGVGTRNLIDAQVKGFAIEQRIGPKLVVDASYNSEHMINPNIDMVRGATLEIRADPNRYLPDRVTPNPNVGRYYVAGQGRGRLIYRDLNEARVMASYDLDLAGRNQWLGNHRLAAMYQRVDSVNGGQEAEQRRIPAGMAFTDVVNIYGAAANSLWYRAYLSDPANPATGRVYYLDSPNIGFEPFTLADGSTVYTTNNPFGGTNSGAKSESLLEGRVFVMQNRFWRDRLVTTFGWRSDQVRTRGRPMARLGGSNSAFESVFTAPLSGPWDYTAGRNTTGGAVLHVLPWLSVFYNQADTWNVPRTSSHNPDGSILPGSTGQGKDYGLMMRFMGDRLSFRLNKYESTSGPDVSQFRETILAPIIAIEKTLYQAGESGLIPSYQPATGFDPNTGNTFFYELTSDKVSKGYEAELVANPIRNWRISLNAAKANATESNIGQVWREFIQKRLPYWSQYTTLQGPDTSTNTISSRFLAIVQGLNLMQQADGRRTEQGREWRVNLLTRYSFSEGLLKGLFVGGGYRWRSAAIIGYRAVSVPNEFTFPGVAAQIVVPALNAPVKGVASNDLEGFLGYSRSLRKGAWRVQLNVRNLLDESDLIAQRANTSGQNTLFTLPPPRTFVLSTTFSY